MKEYFQEMSAMSTSSVKPVLPPGVTSSPPKVAPPNTTTGIPTAACNLPGSPLKTASFNNSVSLSLVSDNKQQPPQPLSVPAPIESSAKQEAAPPKPAGNHVSIAAIPPPPSGSSPLCCDLEPEGASMDGHALRLESSGKVTMDSTEERQQDYDCCPFLRFNGLAASTPIKPTNADESFQFKLQKIDENQTFNFLSMEPGGSAPKANCLEEPKSSLENPNSPSFITDCNFNNNIGDRSQFFCYNRTGEIMFMDTSSPPLECIERMMNNFRGHSKTSFKFSSNQTSEAFFTAPSYKNSASIDYKPSKNAENCRPSTSSAVLLSATPLTSKGHVFDAVAECFNKPALDFCTTQSGPDSTVSFCKSTLHGSKIESNENATACMVNSNELTFNNIEKTCANDNGIHQTDEENEKALDLNVNEIPCKDFKDLDRSSKSFHEDADKEVTSTNILGFDEDVNMCATAAEPPMVNEDNFSVSNRHNLLLDDLNCMGDDGVKQSGYRFLREQNCQPSCSQIPGESVSNFNFSGEDINTLNQHLRKEQESFKPRVNGELHNQTSSRDSDFSGSRGESFTSSLINISSISSVYSVTEMLNKEFEVGKDNSLLKTPIFMRQGLSPVPILPVPIIDVPTASTSACPKGISKIPVLLKTNSYSRRKSVRAGTQRIFQSNIPIRRKSVQAGIQRFIQSNIPTAFKFKSRLRAPHKSSTAAQAPRKNIVKKTVPVHSCCSLTSKVGVPPRAHLKTTLKPQDGKR